MSDEAFDSRSERLKAERTHFEQHVLFHDALDRLEAKERAMREEIAMNPYLTLRTLADTVEADALDMPDAAELMERQRLDLLKKAHEAQELRLEDVDPSYVSTEWVNPEEEPEDNSNGYT